ncbi:MAG: protein-tyrosine-phosphatase [Pirellulaceae bacterium]
MNSVSNTQDGNSDSVFQAEVNVRVERSRALTAARILLLDLAVDAVERLLSEGRQANLLFVCTHNSRRSQFADFWCQFALDLFRVSNVKSSSCGTEVTECNPRTIASLRRSGVEIPRTEVVANPHYTAVAGKSTIELYSKAFGIPGVPTEAVIAMMCCGDADGKCPTIVGAVDRVALLYADPKHSDESPTEAETYDARSREIGAEMFYLARKISELR